jgi:hypothetical protein
VVNKRTASVESGASASVVDWSLGASDRMSAIGVGMESANVTPTYTSAAIESVSAEIAKLQTALAALGDSPAAAAVTERLEIANGMLALAQAEAALDAEKTAEIDRVTAAAASAGLGAELLEAMLAKIEEKYAPAPPAVEVPAPAAPAPYSGRKPIGPRTAERNAVALAAAAVDPTVGLRSDAAYSAFRKEWSGDLSGVSAQAGTRYVSLVAFAGAGVANKADYLSFVPQLRQYLISVGLQAGGNSAASDAWLFASGPHAPDGPKGDDTLNRKFLSGAGVALYADGRFRLAARGTSGVRFVSFDAAASAAWLGGTPAATTAAPAAAPTTPAAPTPPSVVALTNGSLATTARCQHCTARNIVGQSACNACGATDWQIA